MVRIGTVVVSRDFHNFIVLGVSAGVPRAYGATLYWLLMRMYKGWDSTLVHYAKAALPVSHLSCCFNIPFFLFYQPCCLQVIGEMEPPFSVMFFYSVLHIMTFET